MDNVIIADMDLIDQYDSTVREFLREIFDITEYMVTDESTLSDFALSCLPEGYPYEDMTYDDAVTQAEEYMVQKIYDRYGIYTSPTMRLVEVCEMINKPAPTLH